MKIAILQTSAVSYAPKPSNPS